MVCVVLEMFMFASPPTSVWPTFVTQAVMCIERLKDGFPTTHDFRFLVIQRNYKARRQEDSFNFLHVP